MAPNIMERRMEPIPEYGDLMTLGNWRGCVELGLFVDYDGSGYLATATEMYTGIDIYPSQLKIFEFPEWVTHIVWFNK